MAKSRRIYYTMGQVCEMFDLPQSTIRFWEKRFKTLTPRKNAKGNRLFTPADIENLKVIYHLVREKKMTLSGAETYMLQRKVAAKSEMSTIEILQKIKATLVEIRQEIETAELLDKDKAQTIKAIVIKSEQIEELQAFEYKPQTFTTVPKGENPNSHTPLIEEIFTNDAIPEEIDDQNFKAQQLSLF